MKSYLRDHIRAMAGYTPGEQPRDGDFIKLNTNENPDPPSPRVLESLHQAITGDRLRKYPDPMGTRFRQTAAPILSVDPEGILIGNGSDDVLTIVTRAFVPEGGLVVSPSPSYLLYRTLAELQEARFQTVPFTNDWQLPSPWPFPQANLTLLPNPNSPSGTVVSHGGLEQFIAELQSPLILDEAYVDFADANGLDFLRHRDVIITRSLSKSYSLAGIRFGFALADPAIIHEMLKIKDSYNCDALSLVAAEAALEDQDYLRSTRLRILATRRRLTEALSIMGFTVIPSQANFIWCRRVDQPVRPIYEELKRRLILIRYMNYPGYGDGLRISVGSDEEINRLLEELRKIV